MMITHDIEDLNKISTQNSVHTQKQINCEINTFLIHPYVRSAQNIKV